VFDYQKALKWTPFALKCLGVAISAFAAYGEWEKMGKQDTRDELLKMLLRDFQERMAA